MKTQFSIPMISLTVWLGLSYSSFMRWKRRIDANESPVRKPGPKKIAVLDLESLNKDIRNLKHCSKRSHGTCALAIKYQASISRRHVADLVDQARQHARNKTVCRLTWHYPDTAWAIDGCEVKSSEIKTRIYVQNLQDMGSIYKFGPLVSLKEPNGNDIISYLSNRFETYGAPLFLKRDNARNYNAHGVNDLLGEYMVIPLNSPNYYAPYNGGIEHAQWELKSCLKSKTVKTSDDFELQVNMAIHDLNHKPRRKLNGQNACLSYFTNKRQVYSKRKRRQIFDWIMALAIEISQKAGKDKIDPAAWRFACQKWMEENGVITVKKWRKVLPDFSLNFCQN